MRLYKQGTSVRRVLLATAAAFGLACSSQAWGQVAQQINLTTDDNTFLVSQGFAPAANVDPNLINPWGMSYSATSPFWISDQVTGVSTQPVLSLSAPK